MRREIGHIDCCFRIDAHETLFFIQLDTAAVDFRHDHPVARLHDLDHGDAGTDGMGNAPANDDHIAWNNRDLVEHSFPADEFPVETLLCEDLPVELVIESDQKIRILSVDLTCGENDPCFGFSVIGIEIFSGIGASRMYLQRKLFRRIEEFDQNAGDRTVFCNMFGTEHHLGILFKK